MIMIIIYIIPPIKYTVNLFWKNYYGDGFNPQKIQVTNLVFCHFCIHIFQDYQQTYITRNGLILNSLCGVYFIGIINTILLCKYEPLLVTIIIIETFISK